MSKKITRQYYKDTYGYSPNNYAIYKIMAIIMSLFFIFLFGVGIVSAETITINEETGYNYIKWDWSTYENGNTDVFIDGVLTLQNTSIQHYVLSDVNMQEKHIIDVFGVNGLDYGMQESESDIPFMSINQWVYVGIWAGLLIIGGLTLGWFYPLMSLVPSMLLIIDSSINGDGWVMIFSYFTLTASITTNYLVYHGGKR